MRNKTDWFRVQIMALIFALFVIAAILSLHIGKQRYTELHGIGQVKGAMVKGSVFKLALNDHRRVKR